MNRRSQSARKQFAVALSTAAKGKAGDVLPHPSKGKGGPIFGTTARRPTGRVFQQILAGWAPCPKAPPASAHLCEPLCEVARDVLDRQSAVSGSNLQIHFRQSNHFLNLAPRAKSRASAIFFPSPSTRQLDQMGTASVTSRERLARQRASVGVVAQEKAAVSDPEISLPGPSLTRQQNRLQNCRRDAYLPKKKSQSSPATRQIFC